PPQPRAAHARPAPTPPSRRAPAGSPPASERVAAPLPLHVLFPEHRPPDHRTPAAELHAPSDGGQLMADEMPKAAIWDGIDRRTRDAGPPQGQPERRRAPVFGRRPVK
ncbi:MAG: hypothetical protein AAGA69_09285, partial [Pseudomonadota bacterium]